jgi:hypothetical protein
MERENAEKMAVSTSFENWQHVRGTTQHPALEMQQLVYT